MCRMRLVLVAAVVAGALMISPAGDGGAFPGLGGPVVFSTSMIGPAHDVSPTVVPPGITCRSADILTLPGTGPAGPCPARVLPAPPGPVPNAVTGAMVDLGLDLVAGPFSDDLDSLSFGERLNLVTLDFDFSVDPAPANGGVTVGAVLPPPCLPPNVTSEAALLEAQGDLFTTGGMPAGCNQQSPGPVPGDEAVLGLIAPNLAAPGVPPLDNIDALAEYPMLPGPCTIVAGTALSSCAAYTVSAGSAVLPAIAPDPLTLAAVTGGTILAQPGTPAAPPALPAGCAPGGLPCAAVGFPLLGLVAGDDVDALCWFDVTPNGVPDVPIGGLGPGSLGDIYIYSITPASPSTATFSPADLIRVGGSPYGPVVIAPAATLGLLPTDNVDGLICHDNDSDFEGVPDFLDVCDLVPDPAQLDTDGDGIGDACDLDTDSDLDGIPDVVDNCDFIPNPGQENFDGDAEGDVCDADDDNDGNPDATDLDDDNDGVYDAAEAACGGTTPSLLRPERIDGAFAGADDDGDTLVDEALPGGSAAQDCDGDGYNGTAEDYVFLPSTQGDQDPCGTNTVPPTVPASPLGWVADLAAAGGFSANRVNISDLASYVGVPRYYNTNVGTNPGDRRWDIVPGSTFGPHINIVDLQSIAFVASPMLGGVRAFNGPVCPWPP